MIVRALCAVAGCWLLTSSLFALKPDILRSAGAVPAHIAGKFREPTGFQQSSSGQYFVFDRRAHVVHGLDAEQSSSSSRTAPSSSPTRRTTRSASRSSRRWAFASAGSSCRGG
jgi:hypothetical protein